jgi:hypothetical protein
MNLPQLPRQLIRPEPETEDAEIWHPEWKCFCCHDSGIVYAQLARLVVPDYNYDHDRLPVCQSPGCQKGLHWMNLGSANLDMRFTLEICQQLDMQERTDWRLTVERQSIDIRSLALHMTMPKIEYRDGRKERNPNDEREIQQRKTEIEAIPPEDWLRMGDEYKYGKKDKD